MCLLSSRVVWCAWVVNIGDMVCLLCVKACQGRLGGVQGLQGATPCLALHVQTGGCKGLECCRAELTGYLW